MYSKYLSKLLVVFLFISSCTTTRELSQEEEWQKINQLFQEIQDMATSMDCEDPAEWTFISYGSKACGGPVGYIAYSKRIDTSLFLKKIEEHKKLQYDYNKKWGIISDCSVPPQPIGVSCKNGEAVLQYP